MSRAAGGGAGSRSWIGLTEASRILGVSPTTLRRWSDDGILETFTTPGGHRRFDVRSVRRLLPGRPERPTMERLGETPERIARAYRRAHAEGALPWVGLLDDAQRRAFREHGQGIARELLAILDAPTEADRASHVAVASRSAAQYGVAAAALGVGAATIVETFLQFRRPFLAEMLAVSRRRGLDTVSATDLVRRASDAMDELMIATVRAYDETPAGAAAGDTSGSSAAGIDLPAAMADPTARRRRAQGKVDA